MYSIKNVFLWIENEISGKCENNNLKKQ